MIWWDGDAQRELLDGTAIDKYGTSGDTRLSTGSGVASDNGSKSTPALSADILGDWREEVLWRTSDNTKLRIHATTDPTSVSRPSLMQDPTSTGSPSPGGTPRTTSRRTRDSGRRGVRRGGCRSAR